MPKAKYKTCFWENDEFIPWLEKSNDAYKAKTYKAYKAIAQLWQSYRQQLIDFH